MLTRRDLFRIVPSGGAACLGCAGMALCAAQSAEQPAAQPASAEFGAKADMTWEQVFNFAHKGYARILKKLSSRIGNDRFGEMLRDAELRMIRTKTLMQGHDWLQSPVGNGELSGPGLMPPPACRLPTC